MSDDATTHASPRPWRLDDGFECEIVDATGRHVLTATSRYAVPPLGDKREAANAALIVAAVNDRDRFRGIVRRLLESCDAMHALITRLNPNMMPVGDIPPGTTVLGVDVGDVIREARAAIGEDKP